MDKYIEIMAAYWADWQYTAVANTRYSVVVFVVAFLIGWFVISLLKSIKIAKLKKQIQQEKEQLEQAESKLAELSEQQKKEAVQLTDTQQQLEQLSVDYQKSKEEHLALIASKDELFLKSTGDKESEINVLNSTINEKDGLIEQLQGELDQQKANIAQFANAQERIAELEKQASESVTQLSSVKQELQAELNNKSLVAEELEAQKNLAKSHKDKAAELEGQLEGVNNTVEIEDIPEEIVAPVFEQENSIQVEKIAEITIEPDPQPEEAIQESEPESIEPENIVVKDKNNDKQSVVSGMMGWFQALDKKFEADAVEHSDLDSDDEISAVDEQVVDSLSEQISIKTETRAFENKVEKIKQPVKARSEDVAVSLDEDEGSFSEKLGEVADRMDAFQEKFKGFFNK